MEALRITVGRHRVEDTARQPNRIEDRSASGYRGGMSPSDSNTNAALEQTAGAVSGTVYPSDLSDWSAGHVIIDWPAILLSDVLNDAFIIAGVGLVVWLIVRKRK
jgi:hypothetical protein